MEGGFSQIQLHFCMVKCFILTMRHGSTLRLQLTSKSQYIIIIITSGTLAISGICQILSANSWCDCFTKFSPSEILYHTVQHVCSLNFSKHWTTRLVVVLIVMLQPLLYYWIITCLIWWKGWQYRYICLKSIKTHDIWLQTSWLAQSKICLILHF